MDADQVLAFTQATVGVSPGQFHTTILLILFSFIYVWLGWLVNSQWKSWSQGKISFYDFIIRIVRGVLITMFISFFLL